MGGWMDEWIIEEQQDGCVDDRHTCIKTIVSWQMYAVVVSLLTLEYIHCHHLSDMSCQCRQWEERYVGECVCILYVIVCEKRQHSVVMCVGLIQFSAAACASAFDGCGHLWDLGSGKCIMLSLLSMSCCSYTVQFNPFITLCVLGALCAVH